MRFIIKQKDANKFKAIEDITEFNKEQFDKFELYEVRKISANQYDEKLKIIKIEELKKQLASLGVDLNQLAKPVQEETPSEIKVDEWKETELEEEVVTPQNNITMADKHVTFISSEQKLSKIKNRATNKLFTMKELQEHFERFKEVIEKDVPELMYCSYSETGFILNMTEYKNNIPNMLQNGIPVKQIV